jgi:hypothetical protein
MAGGKCLWESGTRRTSAQHGHSAQTEACLSLRKPCRIGERAELPRDQGHITRMPWGRRGCKGRGNLQPVALQKKLQRCPAGSPHGASPALNAFHLSAWMPLQVHPANIRAGNFLFAASADGGISLVPYPPFRRVGICNLASGVEWHGCSQSGWWNLRRLYIMAHVCTITEVISRTRRSNRP